MTCTRCGGTGFLNLHQIPDGDLDAVPNGDYVARVLFWIANNDVHDVAICDCCGDGDGWYGIPGEHTRSGNSTGWDCGRIPECI